jgi:hypothetical protein
MKLVQALILPGTVAAVVMLAIVTIALFLPWVVDNWLIKNNITSEIVKSTEGSASFGQIGLSGFPALLP